MENIGHCGVYPSFTPENKEHTPNLNSHMVETVSKQPHKPIKRVSGLTNLFNHHDAYNIEYAHGTLGYEPRAYEADHDSDDQYQKPQSPTYTPNCFGSFGADTYFPQRSKELVECVEVDGIKQ